MNTKIGRITRRQSCLGGFLPSLERDPTVKSSTSGDNDDDDPSSLLCIGLSFDKNTFYL